MNLTFQSAAQWTLIGTMMLPGLCVLAATPLAMTPLPVKSVRIEDRFWEPRQTIIRQNAIPNSWEYVALPLAELKAAAAAEPKPVEANACRWSESILYKDIETIALTLPQHPDAALDAKLDEFIATITAAQQPDGYVNAWRTNRKLEPWGDLYLSHAGFVAGHLYQAANTLYQVTGKKTLLEIARKSADQAWRYFIQENHPGFCGHAGMEMGLCELAQVTGDKRYLELAQAFIERRGQHPERVPRYTPAYFQDDLPVRQQQEMNGHAVRAVFFASGVAEVAMATGDTGLADAARRLWKSCTRTKMFITGSIGVAQTDEGFGAPYELPNNGYTESCAACGVADLGLSMLMLDGNSSAADEMERVLYNAVAHGLALDGRSSYYCNPLSDHDRLRDNNWTCCPPNLTRTMMKIGKYAYAQSDRDLFVNLYVGGQCQTRQGETPVTLEVKTDYPWRGAVRIEVQPEKPTPFALHLRIPGWCDTVRLELNGTELATTAREKGYVVVQRVWRKGDTLDLNMAMPVMRMEANPKVAADMGKVAIQRGPLIYGLEALDNHGSALVRLGADPGFQTKYRPDLLGGVTVLTGVDVDGKPFQAIPFYVLANRGKSAQEVWQIQVDKKVKTEGWDGRLYREYRP